MDEKGQGWIEKAVATAHLTDRNSPLYLCHERYLRLLLERGDGLLWTWQRGEGGRIWLRSEAKVAKGLGLERLGRTAVSLPLARLLRPLGQVRAYLYASFHAGRMGDGNGGRANRRPAPISRAVLSGLTGASRRTQRRYERQAGIEVETNVAVGRAIKAGSKGEVEEQAWTYGRGWFTFEDRRGQIGPKGGRYQARQLPNSYAVGRRSGITRLRGRKRRRTKRCYQQQRPNSQADLRHHGDAGNGPAVRGHLSPLVARRYFADGAAGAKAWRRRGALGYWAGRRGRSSRLWHPLPGLALWWGDQNDHHLWG
jgi:hypothetical protein